MPKQNDGNKFILAGLILTAATCVLLVILYVKPGYISFDVKSIFPILTVYTAIIRLLLARPSVRPLWKYVVLAMTIIFAAASFWVNLVD